MLSSNDVITNSFKKLRIFEFSDAANYVQNLSYKRNQDKENPIVVLVENGGTCSTKHALLKRLATENSKDDLSLMIGVFSMNEENTPKISPILRKFGIAEIPEAHCYLKYNEEYLDFTRKNSKSNDFSLI